MYEFIERAQQEIERKHSNQTANTAIYQLANVMLDN